MGIVNPEMSTTDTLRKTFRCAQFVMGIVVLGFYAFDLVKGFKQHQPLDWKLAFAVATGGVGALAAIGLAITPNDSILFGIDITIWLSFLVAFCIFGKMYLGKFGFFGRLILPMIPESVVRITREKDAVWMLLANTALWLISAVYSTTVFVLRKKDPGNDSEDEEAGPAGRAMPGGLGVPGAVRKEALS